jgi:ArsR family transcriptional regulator, arsenate/arsenite/antimonite-responsive transcriptional repressor
MARAKTESFEPALVRMADLAKALSHPVRIRILEILGVQKGCICGRLVELLPLAQSTVSQHLRGLRDAGLIQGDVDGPRTCYCLNREAVIEARTAFEGMFLRLCGRPGEIGEDRGKACGVARRTAPPSPERPIRKRKTTTRRDHEKKEV